MLDRDASAVRQLAHRARQHVQARRPRYEVDPATRDDLVAKFRAACLGGDINALMETPGAGRHRVVRRWRRGDRRPAAGAGRRQRHAAGCSASWPSPAARAWRSTIAIDQRRAALLASFGGVPAGSVHFDIDGAAIVGIRMVLNPNKLDGLS